MIMDPKTFEGNVVIHPDLGPVRIVQRLDNGAAFVRDGEGRKWLIPADVILECESSLLFID